MAPSSPTVCRASTTDRRRLDGLMHFIRLRARKRKPRRPLRSRCAHRRRASRTAVGYGGREQRTVNPRTARQHDSGSTLPAACRRQLPGCRAGTGPGTVRYRGTRHVDDRVTTHLHRRATGCLRLRGRRHRCRRVRYLPIKRLVDLGVNATVLDANPDVGGTWWNNRYPVRASTRELHLRLFVFKKFSTNGIGPSAFPQPKRCVTWTSSSTSSVCAHTCSSSAGSVMVFDEGADVWHLRLNDGRSLSARRGHRHRSARDADLTENPGYAGFQGTVLPYPRLATRTARSHRQAHGDHRHGRDRHPDHPGGGRTSGPVDGIPAPRQLGGTAQQRPDYARGDGRDPCPLRRDLRRLRALTGGVRTRAGPTQLL